MSMAVKKLVTLFKTTEITKLWGSQEDEKNKIIKPIFSKIQQKTHKTTLKSTADYQSKHRSSGGTVDLIVKDKI